VPIIASGIGSGLDIGGLVAQLVAAEAEPANARFNTKETALGSELSAYGTLKSALSTFNDAATKLESADTFKVFSASSSNETTFTTSVDTTAGAGSYSIEVTQLAQAAKVRSADFTSETEVIGTGTLDISLGADTFQLTIDSNNNTLAGIRDAINAATDNPGISASLINVDSGTQLILSSSTVGATNAITVAAVDNNGADGFDLTRLDSASLVSLQGATDAIIKVDTQTITRDSNNFSDVISGVTFNLLNATPGTVETLSVVSDTATIKKDIESFVTNYNVLIGVMKGLSNFDASTNVAGALNGDSVLRSIQSRMQQSLSAIISGGAFSNLSELGIQLGDSGSIVIDDVVLDDKLNNNLSDVSTFFSSTTGMAQTFTGALAGYVDNNGIIDSRTEGLQTRLDGISDKRGALNRRMASFEARLNAQFTAMDILVAQLRSTGNFLTQQLANLPGFNNTSR